jgi:alginate O-acetyltransferase complex protein AlgI
LLFSSNLFVFVFLPAILALYYCAVLIGGRKLANPALLAASLAFYAWGSGWVVIVLVGSILFNFTLGNAIATASDCYRRWLLGAAVAVNLAVLFHFKYSEFAYDNATALASRLGLTLPPPPTFPGLPVGISFYTFMAIAYLIDTHHRSARARSMSDFALFLSLFPHLVAGPIVRFSEIKSDIESRHHNLDQFFDGTYRFCIGMGKKVLIANTLSVPADAIFALPADQLTTSLAWLGALCYSLQIFFDFSGYTDMAIGLALMLGFKFPENFSQPYRSSSVTEFWRRWHMSLTRWFRDYLYIPLGGSRRGRFQTFANLFIVFFLCGLWHGAAWTFVLWGMYHGLLLIMERMIGPSGKLRSGIPGVFMTFILVTVGWVLFRSTTIEGAGQYLLTMFSFGSLFAASQSESTTMQYHLTNNVVLALGIGIVLSFWKRGGLVAGESIRSVGRPGRRVAGPTLARGLSALIVLLLSLAFLSDATYNPFIYFRF